MKPSLEKMKDVSEDINEFIKNRDWSGAINLLLCNAEIYPDEYWPNTILAQMYMNKKQYDKALHYGSKAMDMNPDDYLVIYNYADALMYNGRLEEGIALMKKIVDENIFEIAYGPYGEGLKYAKRLVGDSLASIGYAYLEQGDVEKARMYFKKHLAQRQRGIHSSFRKKIIERELDLYGNQDVSD